MSVDIDKARQQNITHSDCITACSQCLCDRLDARGTLRSGAAITTGWSGEGDGCHSAVDSNPDHNRATHKAVIGVPGGRRDINSWTQGCTSSNYNPLALAGRVLRSIRSLGIRHCENRRGGMHFIHLGSATIEPR